MTGKRKADMSDIRELRKKQLKEAFGRSAGQDLSSNTPRFGIIHSITLKNFMCHSNLTMTFEGNVNFVVGNNGSGKSAVLSALIIGLGGKTVSTSRGTSLKNLIKSGCSYAVIRISLRNDGEEVVETEIYGDRIIIERKISIDGSSSYKLKTSCNKLISVKREDVMFVLDELNIQVDNPLTCLNQELSKNFLHTKSESDKYKFFLKTTQLEQLNKDYNYIKSQRVVVEESIRRKELALPGLEKIVFEKEDAFRNLATLNELRDRAGKLRHELAWSHVSRLEQDLKPIQKELEREKIRTVKYDKVCREIENREKAAKQKVDTLKAEVAKITGEKEKLNPEREMAERVYEQHKSDYRKKTFDFQKACRQHKEVTRDLKALEERILTLKNEESDNRLLNEYKRQKEELEKLKVSEVEMEQQLEAVSKEINTKSSVVMNIREKSGTIKRDYQENQRKVDSAKSALNSLSTGRRNKLKLFGHKMPDLINKIQEAHRRRQFKQLPRGPIGNYLSVRDMKLAVPVECSVRNYLFSFIVDNHADEKMLERLRNSVFYQNERSRISIYTMKFSNTKYDVSRNKVQHSQYSSVLDLLVIEDPIVANCLVDIGAIETQLVIPETQDALRIMQGANSPRNCSRCFTKVGDEVYVDRFYSNRKEPVSQYLGTNIEDEIKRKTESLKRLEEEGRKMWQDLSDVNNQLKSAQQDLQQQQNKKNSLQHRLNNLKIEIRRLQTLEEPVTIDWKDLEDEVANYERKDADIVKEKETTAMKKKEAAQILEKSKEKFQKLDAELKKIISAANVVVEKVASASSELDKTKGEQSHYKEGKKKHLASINRLQNRVNEQLKFIETESEKARIVCPQRISTKRIPTNIEKEIDQVGKRIDQEEKKHGRRDLIVREAADAKSKYSKVQKQLRWCREFRKQILDYISTREVAYASLQKLMAVQCVIDFDVLLRQRNFAGELVFDHEAKVIKIVVNPKDKASNSKDLRALSGGERSFSTVCFILSLWQVMQSPLRCLDEFDVFMDMANRRVAMEMMVDMALLQPKIQFIFLTPHDISSLPGSQQIHVWKMADPKRSREDGDVGEDRKGTISSG